MSSDLEFGACIEGRRRPARQCGRRVDQLDVGRLGIHNEDLMLDEDRRAGGGKGPAVPEVSDAAGIVSRQFRPTRRTRIARDHDIGRDIQRVFDRPGVRPPGRHHIDGHETWSGEPAPGDDAGRVQGQRKVGAAKVRICGRRVAGGHRTEGIVCPGVEAHVADIDDAVAVEISTEV